MKSLFPKNIGIHIRVLSAAVFLISATTFTMGYLGVNIINEFVTQRFNQRIDFMAQYLALNSELGILINEKNLLRGWPTTCSRKMISQAWISQIIPAIPW
jgi:hypothetical protein